MMLPWLVSSLVAARRTAVRRNAAKRQAAKPARFRPRVELLETRFAPAIIVGPNVNITRFQGSQNEAAISMNPTNTLNLFEVSNDNFLAVGTGGLLGAFSMDGGITWTREFIATGVGTIPAACCDPQAVFDGNGNLFVSYINAAVSADELLLSTNGGQTFSLLQEFGTAIDQPKLAVGPGSVWVSFADSTGGISASGAVVGGLGSVGAFTVPQQLDGSLGANFGEMSIGPSGQVVVVYPVPIGTSIPDFDNPGAPVAIMENLNPTGVGGTFGPSEFITTSNVGQLDAQIGAAGNVGVPPTGIDSEPKVEFDNSGGPFTGRLYLVFTDSPTIFSVTTDIFVQHSDDNGATWTPRVKINDNTVLDETFYPSLAIDQMTGTLAVQFYDTRNDQGQGGPLDPNNAPMDDVRLWASASFDGGVTWAKNVPISAGTSNGIYANANTPLGLRLIGFGDYMHSTAFFGGVWYPVWADNSNSTGDNPDGTLLQPDIYTAKVTVVAGSTSTGLVPIVSSTPGSTGTTGLIPIVPNPPPVVDPTTGGTRTSDGADAFLTTMWGAWSPTAHWSAVVKGDFNGDGMTDTAGFDQQTGQWVVSLSNGSSFTTSVWANWSPLAHWSNIRAGDFTGDGKTDIIGYTAGQWWVGVSNGSSFTTSLWGTWSPAVNWTDFQVADFTGNGMADITARDPASGGWWTGVSTGSSFSTSLWAVWSPAVTWVDVNVGDFTGSGVAGITGRVLQSGQWWTGLSTGSGFATSLWATWSPYVTWVDVHVADFNGDGKADIVGRVLQSGQWWVGQSTGSGFSASLWATWSPLVNWVNVQVGDFNGDGMADITGMVQGNGQWWTGVSTGSSFSTSLWATWSPNLTWVDVQVGNFNGAQDIMGMALQSGQWWAGLPAINLGLPPGSTTGPIGSTSSTSTTTTSTGLIGSVPHL